MHTTKENVDATKENVDATKENVDATKFYLLERATQAVEVSTVSIVSTIGIVTVLSSFKPLEIVTDESSHPLVMLPVFEHVRSPGKSVVAILVQAMVVGNLGQKEVFTAILKACLSWLNCKSMT